MELAYATWDEVEKFCQSCDLALIPTGAVETKGYHQPMATDAVLGKELSVRLSRRINALVVPTVTVGVAAAGATSFFGSLQVSPETYRNYVQEICDWLVNWGLKRFIFISGHGPNADPLEEVAWYLKRKHQCRCAYVQVNPFLRRFSEDLVEGDNPYLHAGEIEACLMLHWRPDLVKLQKAVVCHPKSVGDAPGLKKFEDLEFDFGFMTESGSLGDPTLASAEKGKIIEQRMLDFLVKYIETELS